MDMQRFFAFMGLFVALSIGTYAQPQIIQDPQSKTAVAGAMVTFSVEAAGSTPMQYQWQFNGQDIPRANARLLRLTAVPSRAGTYSVRVRYAAGERVSRAANLEVFRRPAFIVQPKNAVVGEHTLAEFTTVLNDSGPYRRMIWHNNNPIEGPHEIPPSTGYITDRPILSMDDPINDATWNSVYWLAVTNGAAGITSRRARLRVVGPPVLQVQPQPKTVKTGATVILPVRVTPNPGPPETFQWYKDGRVIPGAVFKKLILKNVQATDAGNYYCIVNGIGGTTTSWGAFLTVE
jgi:hypothetical protein